MTNDHQPTIAIDIRGAGYTGMGRFTRSTVGRIARMDAGLRFVVLANPAQDLDWLPESDTIDVVRLRREVPVYSPWEHVELPRAVRESGCDLVHFTNFNTPWTCPTRFVVTIHDTIYLRLPWAMASRLRAWYAGLLMRRSAAKAAQVITISEHSRRDIEELLRVPHERISIAPCGGWAEGEMPTPGPEAIAQAQAHAPYVLYVGNQNPHKNVAGLAAAVAVAKERHPALKLAAVGPKGKHFARLQRELHKRNVADVVEFLDHVSDELLIALYQRAAVVSTATLYEGFGLPVLEGFCAGAPVVASDRTSIPEVAGDAALLADPEDPRAFGDAIASVLDDPALRQRLIDAGRERAKRFTWDRCAERIVEVYRKLTQEG